MSNQIQRILVLDRWLRERRKLVASKAAAHLGVDERTIRRDLKEVLRDRWQLPVRYDRSTRAWYYDGEPQSLPSTFIGPADRLALLISLQSAEQYRGTPLYDNLRAIHRRLLDLLPPETRTGYKSLARKIRFEGPPMAPIAQGVWNTLLNALEEPTTLRMVYKTGSSGEVRERCVDPYGMVARHREWYLIGWDHLRQAVRTFFVPRIKSVEDTGEPFDIKDDFGLDRYLATAVDSHQSTGPTHRVRLRFTKEASVMGEEYVWNVTQTISRDEEGRSRDESRFLAPPGVRGRKASSRLARLDRGGMPPAVLFFCSHPGFSRVRITSMNT